MGGNEFLMQTGTHLRRGQKREVVNPNLDPDPMKSDDDGLRSYGYCAVRKSVKGEFLDRCCVGQSPKEVEERVTQEKHVNPLFHHNNPVVRVAKITILEVE